MVQLIVGNHVGKNGYFFIENMNNTLVKAQFGGEIFDKFLRKTRVLKFIVIKYLTDYQTVLLLMHYSL